MPPVKNLSREDCIDFDANIRHYQDLNSQIEQKTFAVFQSVKLSNHGNLDTNNYGEPRQMTESNEQQEDAKNKPLDGHHNALARSENRDKITVNKNQIIVDLNHRLRDLQSQLETTTIQQKKLEEERDQQRHELNCLKENVKKMKNALHTKQLLHESHKKEIVTMLEKFKIEEQTRKALQKEIERLSKQLATTTSEKEKLAEKLEHSKTDLILLKQHKIDEHPGNKVPIMLKCIRKQAFLIENLFKQISYLEQTKN